MPREPGEYELEFTPEYTEELLRIDGGSGYLEARLQMGLYHTLRRNPFEGVQSQRTGLWVLRYKVLESLLLVQVAYRIDELEEKVTLVAIREVAAFLRRSPL